MMKPLNNFTKSASLMTSWPPHTEADARDIPVLGISTTHPNIRCRNRKKRIPNIRCHDCSTVNGKRMLQGFMYRRQLLLASTSLPLKPQQMMAAMPPPPANLKDYHKLAKAVQEAQKLKNSQHGSPEVNDVVCWLRSPGPLKPPNSRTADQLSGVVAAPPGQEFLRRGINEKEVVTARVRRPETFKLRSRDKEEQVVLQGIEVTNDKPLCFDVYIKSGQEREEEEYLGTFSHMPPRPKQRDRHDNNEAFDGRDEQKRVRKCCLRLGMNDILIDGRPLNVHQKETLIVKLVPTFKVDEDPIKVDRIFIDYT